MTWQIEHVLAKVPVRKAVEKTKQAARGDDRAGTRSVKKLQRLENFKKDCFLGANPGLVFTGFQLCYPM